MKKAITTTFLILCLGAALPISQSLAAVENEVPESQETSQQDWQQALKTQVALARAKVSLFEARTELLLEQNKTAALQSLDETQAYLDEAWRFADQVTRARITELKVHISRASKLIQQQGQEAEVELGIVADRSESALNSALAQARSMSTDLKDQAATRYELLKAKVAALNARIALEIDQAPEKAQQALLESSNYLQQARDNASQVSAEHISPLQEKVHAAQQAVGEKTAKTNSHISAVVIAIEEHLKGYGKTIRESEEAKLLNKRYGQLEARAALLKANLAIKTDATWKQTTTYLDESRAWYDGLKSQASQRWNEELTDMSKRIEEAKQAVERKDKQARARIAQLLEQAAAMLKDEEPDS